MRSGISSTDWEFRFVMSLRPEYGTIERRQLTHMVSKMTNGSIL